MLSDHGRKWSRGSLGYTHPGQILTKYSYKKKPPRTPIFTGVHKDDYKIKPLRQGIVLDGFYILDETFSDRPEQVFQANFTGRTLSDTVPVDLQYFVNLKYIDLGDNNIPLNKLSSLPAVEEIHLHCNGIRTISPFQSNELKTLRILGLAQNELTYQALLNLTSLSSLHELDISFNNVQSLPEEFSNLTNLRKLSLGQNQLREPEDLLILSVLPFLQHLDLSYNNFNQLSMMSQLESDDSEENSEFPSLEFLDFSYNCLPSQQECLILKKFKTLEILDLRGNPFVIDDFNVKASQYPHLYKYLVLTNAITIILGEPENGSDSMLSEQHYLAPPNNDNEFTKPLSTLMIENTKPKTNDGDVFFLTQGTDDSESTCDVLQIKELSNADAIHAENKQIRKMLSQSSKIIFETTTNRKLENSKKQLYKALKFGLTPPESALSDHKKPHVLWKNKAYHARKWTPRPYKSPQKVNLNRAKLKKDQVHATIAKNASQLELCLKEYAIGARSETPDLPRFEIERLFKTIGAPLSASRSISTQDYSRTTT